MPTATPATKEPWQMTRAEFLATKPKATRLMERYSSEQRAERAASQRMGHRQRQAVGEFFYMNHLEPNSAYPTAKQAKIGLHRAFIRRALTDGYIVPRTVLDDYPDIRAELAGE